MIWILLGIVAIFLLILLSAFFSGSEMALISLNKGVIREKMEKGVKGAKILDSLLKDPDRVVGAILIGNNLVNISASIIAGAIATKLVGNMGIGIAMAVMTLLILVFSEMTPKALAIGNDELAFKVAKPINFLTRLFHPIAVVLNSISNFLIKLTGIKKKRSIVTEGEIKAMLEIGEEDGTIQADEREMIHEVFEFDETVVRDVMIPREKMVCIQKDSDVRHLLKIVNETGITRIPVYEKNLDGIIGMAHAKDILKLDGKNVPIKEMMRPILKVDGKMRADDVLRKMQRENTHLAIVKNDGKTLGLVSMEDLIEEIVGEIEDEHDPK